MNEKMKLNLGSSDDYKKGWINLDIAEGKDIYGNKVKVDVIWDLNTYPYPFQDNTFEEINASAVIEHLISRTKIWDELKRIAKNGCKIHVSVPHYSSYTPYGDITHYQSYSYLTVKFIEKMWNFKVLNNKFKFSANPLLRWINPIVNIFPRFYERFFSNIFPSCLLLWEFEVVK